MSLTVFCKCFCLSDMSFVLSLSLSSLSNIVTFNQICLLSYLCLSLMVFPILWDFIQHVFCLIFISPDSLHNCDFLSEMSFVLSSYLLATFPILWHFIRHVFSLIFVSAGGLSNVSDTNHLSCRLFHCVPNIHHTYICLPHLCISHYVTTELRHQEYQCVPIGTSG